MNDNGERLCDLCSANGFILTGTIFPHKDIHKLTWRSPDGRTVKFNLIDHVLVNGSMRTSILDTRIMRAADVYSDHYLVKTRVRLKLERAEGRIAKEDERNWSEKRAAAAEKAAENGRSKEYHSITKSITGEKRKQKIGLKDKQGVLRTEIRERLGRDGRSTLVKY